MLLPLARSNLKQYLWYTSRPELNSSFVQALLKQITNLADALNSIHTVKRSGLIAPGAGDTRNLSPESARSDHRRTGYHHDLKPENILIFSGPDSELGEWKISDFGTAKIHSMMSGHSHFSRKLSIGDPVYSSPDEENPKYNGTSRPYDIWSFGCILLEILEWLFGSTEGGLATFSSERFQASGNYASFWIKKAKGFERSPPVVKRLEKLAQVTQAFDRFPKLVELASSALEIDPAHRPTSWDLLRDIATIQLQVDFNLRDDPDFYLKPGQPHLAFASPPTSRWPSAHSDDSRSVTRSPSLDIPWKSFASQLEVPESPHTPRPRSPSGERPRRSTDSFVGYTAGQTDLTEAGAHVQGRETHHLRSGSYPQVFVSESNV